jgi:hypothetical protein
VPGNDGFREIPDKTLFVTFPLQDFSPGCMLGRGLSFPIGCHDCGSTSTEISVHCYKQKSPNKVAFKSGNYNILILEV